MFKFLYKTHRSHVANNGTGVPETSGGRVASPCSGVPDSCGARVAAPCPGVPETSAARDISPGLGHDACDASPPKHDPPMASAAVDVLDAGVGGSPCNRGGNNAPPSKNAEASKTGEQVVSETELVESDEFHDSAGVDFGGLEETEIMESSAHGMCILLILLFVLWLSCN